MQAKQNRDQQSPHPATSIGTFHAVADTSCELQPISQLTRGVRDRLNHHNGAIRITAYGEPKPKQEFLNELVLSADKLERLSPHRP